MNTEYFMCTWNERTEECAACSGELCWRCGAGCWRPPMTGPHCEHDSLERHGPAEFRSVTES